MIDIKFIRQNPDEIKKAAANKNISLDVDKILLVDKEKIAIQQVVQQLQEERNKNTASIVGKPTPEQIEKGKQLKAELEQKEEKLRELENNLKESLLHVPNPAAPEVPVAKDESGNVEVRKVGTLPTFDFTPKSHEELALALDLYDTKHATAIGGTRAYFLKNDLVLLEQAVLRFALDLMIQKGFTPLTAPVLVNKEALWGTGYFPWGKDDHYTTQDDQGLAGTSEVALTAYHQGEILDEKDLPIKYVGISPCFRREIGSYGKDTKGFIRVHQFNKVEQVVLSLADEEDTKEWHEKMVGFSEEILQQLGLPYHVLLMCTGDMGAGQRKKYDIETWFPSQNTYRETHSASYFNDFQSRRLGIKYKAKDGTIKYVYTLNNTVIATPRILAAILENYQQKDGTIKIPDVLQKYIDGKKIITAKK